MISKNNSSIIGSIIQFSPYIFFLTTYGSLYYYTLHAKNIYQTSSIIAGLPLSAAFIATMYAFFTFKESLSINKKVDIFLSGVAHHTAIECYFIIIFMAIFNHLIAKTNGVLTAVTLGLLYIPTLWIMSSIFLLAAIISTIIISLPVTILICMPIACGIAQSLQINSSFMAATIISGALCGNHILLFFKKFTIHEKLNFKNLYQKTIWFIIPATIITLIMLSQYTCYNIHPTILHHLQSSLTIQNYITLIPYCFLLFANLFDINLLAKLVMASCIALIIEITYHKMIFLDAITTMFSGFYETSIVVNLLLLYLMIAGLTNIIEYNGGFHYMIELLKFKKNQNSLKIISSVVSITILTNLLVIIDTLSLHLITHTIEEFTAQYNISQNKITNLFHIITTLMQTILPYSAIMLLSIHIYQTSYIEILSYMIYPTITTILTAISILLV